eukprot:GHVR01120064.1.p1 GENE.GHVR01120064.1~~GHVR01120064.1.p1  ORF type:complete len:752 (+),score=153.57 GHVR01120064.1:81-2336(+)
MGNECAPSGSSGCDCMCNKPMCCDSYNEDRQEPSHYIEQRNKDYINKQINNLSVDFAKNKTKKDPITILHFNDVYNVNSQYDGVGGAARFITALRSFQKDNPLVLFSGDCFSPSMISSYTQGKHMVQFLNMFSIHTACFGSHDFDFGCDHLEILAGSCKFPFLLSNVLDKKTKRPLANAQIYRLFEWQGHRIGVIGLVEREWLDTLSCVSESDCIYEDFVQCSNRMSQLLRSKGANLVIALTHMRGSNDEKLARRQTGIDLILGGHDHEWYGCHRIGPCVLAKSGTDFREFQRITIHPGSRTDEAPNTSEDRWPPIGSFLPIENREGGKCILKNFIGGSMLEWTCVEVTPKEFPSVASVEELVDMHLMEYSCEDMDKVVCEIAVPLDTRFGEIRKKETNASNWVGDVIRAHTSANIVILNSGTIRSDCIFEPGELTVKDIYSMFPMIDPLCVCVCTGEQIQCILEHGVSMHPKTEGRYPIVSGIKFTFNSNESYGNRVNINNIYNINSNGEWVPLIKDKCYFVCTKEYLRQGKDGYDMLALCPVAYNSDVAGVLPNVIINTLKLAETASNLYSDSSSQLTDKQIESILCVKNVKFSSIGFTQCPSSRRLQLHPHLDNRISEDNTGRHEGGYTSKNYTRGSSRVESELSGGAGGNRGTPKYNNTSRLNSRLNSNASQNINTSNNQINTQISRQFSKLNSATPNGATPPNYTHNNSNIPNINIQNPPNTSNNVYSPQKSNLANQTSKLSMPPA